MIENDNAAATESPAPRRAQESRTGGALRLARVAWALLSVVCVASLVMGLSVLPAAAFWAWHLTWPVPIPWRR